MSARINARLDDELAAQVDELRRLTGKSLTQLLEAALRAYYAQMAPSVTRPGLAFQQAGFIGCARGPKNLSRTYKRGLAKSLSRKT